MENYIAIKNDVHIKHSEICMTKYSNENNMIQGSISAVGWVKTDFGK